MKVLRYTPLWANRWNELVKMSPNGTFLHNRRYMDYHSDRFIDISLLVLDDKERLIACLPANLVNNVVCSHGGLTYGGWLVDCRYVTASVMLEIWTVSMAFFRQLGCTRIVYKAIPSIYHKYPADDDIYAIFRCGGNIDSVQISCTVDLRNPMPFDTNAQRAVKHATACGVTVRESTDFADFWHILSDVLKERYDATPVHSLAEIEMLRSRFPENIRHYAAYHDERMVAGVVVYETDTVAHAQYIAASPDGRNLKALPLLFSHIMQQSSHRARYFDFGTSNENRGAYLNEGLIRQKSGMGGRGIAYVTYSVPLL